MKAFQTTAHRSFSVWQLASCSPYGRWVDIHMMRIIPDVERKNQYMRLVVTRNKENSPEKVFKKVGKKIIHKGVISPFLSWSPGTMTIPLVYISTQTCD